MDHIKLTTRKLISNINKGGSIASSIVLFCMMLLICSDVVGRYFFDMPVPGTYEICSVFTAVVVFAGIAYAQEKKRHIFVQFVLFRMSTPMRES